MPILCLLHKKVPCPLEGGGLTLSPHYSETYVLCICMYLLCFLNAIFFIILYMFQMYVQNVSIWAKYSRACIEHSVPSGSECFGQIHGKPLWVRFPYLAWIFMMFSHTAYSYNMILFHIHVLIILGARFKDLVDHSRLYRITDLKST